MAKKQNQTKEKIALSLYLSGETQKDIAEQIGVSRVTLSGWIKKGRWETLRAAKTLTRTELTNKMLMTVNQLLDEAIEKKDNTIADSLVKVQAPSKN